MRALLVEDDPAQRALVRGLLEVRGHAVASFGDADAAWEECRREVFPLAVIDLQLPGRDGLWLARRIRELPHGDVTTILMVVGQAARDNLSQVLA